MKLSIVIPAFNEEKLLPRTLAAVEASKAAFTTRGWDVDVTVCDNNSTDRTAEIARAAGARVVFEPVNQIARARNAGAARATGDWLLFLGADSVPSLALFEEAVSVVGDRRVMFVGACVALDEQLSRVTGMLLAGWNVLSRALNWMAGSFVLVETAAFRAVGGFNEALYAGEEVDLSRRLKAEARRTGRRVTILRKHSLVSSARRMKMYTPWEVLGWVARAMVRPWSMTRDRAACGWWYDGRR